ncbi:MAG: hypothetical protein WAK84_01690 [Candidatus Cybelea sp.]
MNFGRRALGVSAAAVMISSCSGPQPPGAMGPPSQQSPTLLGAAATDLLYVSHQRSVDMIAYPAGAIFGTLRFHAAVSGLCSNPSGDVFISVRRNITDGRIYEYAHGATKPTTIIVSRSGAPFACAFDATTGNLAVAMSVGSGPGHVAIYPKITGKQIDYEDPVLYGYYYCAFDGDGNLFVDDYSNVLGELAKGRRKFSNYKLRLKANSHLGTMQWDGKYLAVEELPSGSNRAVLDRIAIVYSGFGRKAEIAGKTRLNGDAVLFASLNGAVAIGIEGSDHREIGLWHYPAGGTAFKTLEGDERSFYGVAFSTTK